MDIDVFGKDHWSVFAYAETCCVDRSGNLDMRRLGVNESKRAIRSNGLGWKPEWATRVKGGGQPDSEHDDIDSLDDLEKAGLLVWVGTLINPAVKLTDRGIEVASQLRAHKATGGQFAEFLPTGGAG